MSYRGIGMTVLALGMAGQSFGQAKSSATAAGKAPAGKAAAKAPVKEAALVPLAPRERAQQMLNRFTFGPRPGEVERVLAEGPDRWFEEQLNPQTIKDDALNRRLGDFPTLNMSPDQALLRFPDRGAVERVAKGQTPYPSDPLLASLYEVQVFKYNDDLWKNKVDASGKKAYDPSDAEVAAQKKTGQAEAARIAGVLFSLPRNQRMAALIKMPVAERIAFTSYLQGDQRNLLLAEFTPVEREIFTAMAANINSSYQIGQELAQAKMVRAVLSERQLQEVMADFWFNHFNVYVGKDADQWYTTSYDRDAIRKNALGKFRDLLMATATSPAMMIYLDNWLSIGPDSKANAPGRPGGKPGNKGLNENYGREVMELHTVGVNGGYTQTDVTALAAILTGWGVDRPYQGAGGFLFDPKKHEPGVKQWYGHTIGTADVGLVGAAPVARPGIDPGMQEGVQALTILAASPKTAHFISWEIAQRFVADDPPAALVDRMAKTYLASDGDIKAVLRTMAQSPEFNSKKYFRNKVKTPVEYLASAFRTTATDPSNPGALVNTAKQMGMPLFYALPPTGYYITAEQWMNSSALVDRLNFAYQLTNNKFSNQKFDSAHVLALGLMAQPAMAQGASVQTAAFSPDAGEGVDVALRVLETTLIGGSVSAQTNELIHKQVDPQAGMSPNDRLNLLTALVMGSPEFQLR
jgi:uncharacterized protein (DUF1800 family)